MFIKFDGIDLMGFFNSEPFIIGEPEECNCIFAAKDAHGISLRLFINTYEQVVLITILHEKGIVFRGEFQKVKYIKVDERREELYVYTETQRIIIKKQKVFGVILEELNEQF